jgi:hypothetical protein
LPAFAIQRCLSFLSLAVTESQSTADDPKHCASFLDLMLFAFFCTALAISLSTGCLYAEVFCRFGHLHVQECRVSKRLRSARPFWIGIQTLENLGGDGASEWGRDGVSNLSGSMPFRGVESKPIGKTMKAGHLTNRDAAGVFVMYRSGARESPARTIRSSAERIREPVRGEPEKTAYGLHVTGRGGREPASRNICVSRPGA